MSNWKASYKLDYRGHIIQVKRDFGNSFHIVDGMPTDFGYIVCKGFCNAVPGAGWFQTVKDAKRAIDILVEIGGEENSAEFHRRYREGRA